MELASLEIVQQDACGDNLKASIDYGAAICIEVEEPWAGDTETGFGRSGAVRLTRDQALTLATWLQEAAAALPKEPA